MRDTVIHFRKKERECRRIAKTAGRQDIATILARADVWKEAADNLELTLNAQENENVTTAGLLMDALDSLLDAESLNRAKLRVMHNEDQFIIRCVYWDDRENVVDIDLISANT